VAFVTWTENALEDLEAIHLFVARSAPGAADVLTDRMFEATARLASFPAMGRRIPDVTNAEVRELIVGSYRIAYRLTGDEVEILAVHHGARNPASLEPG
jgi:toxin ParE1/3/4